MALPTPGTHQRAIYDAAQKALTDPTIDNKTMGLCAGWTREVLERVSFIKAPPNGLDAIAQEKWLKDHGARNVGLNGMNVGDVIYWNVGHGRHGHVGINMGAGMAAMNTSLGNLPGEDAREMQSIRSHGMPSAVYRLWR